MKSFRGSLALWFRGSVRCGFSTYDESLSKVLFMVAMTRSKKNLYITYSGYKHAYVNNFAGDCHLVDIHDNLSGQTVINGSNNIFGF